MLFARERDVDPGLLERAEGRCETGIIESGRSGFVEGSVIWVTVSCWLDAFCGSVWGEMERILQSFPCVIAQSAVCIVHICKLTNLFDRVRSSHKDRFRQRKGIWAV
jgi:hypothetical protein